MFVTKSKYDSLLSEKYAFEAAFYRLNKKWNNLVDTINEKGGRIFLDGEIKNKEFNEEEIKILIQLCHPDKHNGKQIAIDITKKLLDIRD